MEKIKMKRITYLILLAMIMLITAGTAKNVRAEDAKLSIPVSFSYSSTYWWRGYELDGKNVGVLWPGVGLNYGDLAVTFAAGIAETWITEETSALEKSAKSLTEIDLGAAYTFNRDKFSVVVGVMYVGYPYYDAAIPNAVEASFIESSAVLTIKTLLSPYVAFYYDYFLHEADTKTPVNEDYYVKVGASHNLISTEDGFAFSLGAYVGYYNNAYLDMSGWSDAVATTGISKNYKNMSFTSNFNYGRTLGKDFRKNTLYNAGKKNHFWASFGATVTL
jgi:hypothetical protein